MTRGSLSRERWDLLEPLVDEALELGPAERAKFVDATRARDARLGADLDALLRACEDGTSLLGAPAAVALAPLLHELEPVMPSWLGRYHVVREIGRGGMATVYLADDTKHGRQVAVKVLHTELARIIGRERFLREIEIAAGLSHPHILPLHDSGESRHDASTSRESLLFFVSPYVAGESLRDLIRRDGRVSDVETVRLGREIALALDYAHRQGVIHLDIKPANILLQDGHAVIADFGIARAMTDADAGDARGEQSGVLLGTPSYMSPEQASGSPELDGRSDVYSLGCVLHEMLTGARPSTDDGAALNAVAPPRLAAVVARAMADRAEDRFATAGDLARALSESISPSGDWRQRARRGAIYALAAALMTSAAFVGWTVHQRSANAALPTIPAVTPKSIAVLPFENMNADKDRDYFSDGLTQDLIGRLAKSSDLRVTASNSAFRFRGSNLPVREIARQLGVTYVLSGAVHTIGDVLHVQARLVRASDSTVIWSERYDRRVDDVLTIRNDIVDRSAKALNTTLLADALTADTRSGDAVSYNLMLRGRYFLIHPTAANIDSAVDYFKQAIAAEPDNAAAYASLARAYRVQAGEGWRSVLEGYELSRQAAQKAIELDPRLADGYEALAYIQSAYDWDWEAAESSYRHALQLAPGNAEVLRSVALLMAKLGRLDEAVIGLRKAIERDPSFIGTYSNLSYVLGAAGRWDEAEAAARTALALGPQTVLRHFNLTRALLFQGKNEEALREIALEKGDNWRLMGEAVVYHALGRAADSDRSLAAYKTTFANHAAMQIAEVHAYRGETDSAFTWLDRAYAQRDPGIADLRNDPWLASVRHDPRYAVLMQRMKLAR